MNKAEFENISRNENSHYYYLGINKEIIDLLCKYFKQLELKDNIKILDAGCGTGFLAKKLEKLGDVVGVDVDPYAIKFAKAKKLKVYESSVENLPFEDNLFDIITSIDVLYHQNVNEEKALQEFYRVLKPRGLLILKLPAFNFLKGKHDLYVQTKRRYTKRSISCLLKKEGFQEIRSTYLASFLFLPALLKRSIERWSGLDNLQAESDVKKLPKIINSLLIFLFYIENLLLKYINLPIGLSIFSISKKV